MAGGTITLQFKLVALQLEADSFGKAVQAVLDGRILGQHEHLTATQAGGVMMVFVEVAAQFELVLPPGLQTLHDAELFEQGDGTVDGGAVYATSTCHEFVHSKRLFALQCLEYGLTRRRKALMVCP